MSGERRNSVYFLVVDVGTEGTKSAVISDSGLFVATSYQEYDLEFPREYWATQDPRVWWNAVKKTVKEALALSKISPDAIAAMGVCGQMHAPIPFSRDGEILYHQPPLWLDKRNIEQCESLRKTVDEEGLLPITGNPITPAWMGLKIKWIKDNLPSVYEKTHKFLTPKDSITFMLTGQFVIDKSEASGSFLFDSRKDCWSSELAEMLGVDLEKLPPIFSSHEVVGELRRDVAQEFALRSGIPVIAGGGDFCCAMLGAGGVFENIAIDVAGTSSLMAACTREIKTDLRLMNLRHVVEGWILFNEVEAGLAKWFKENFADAEKKMAQESGRSVYSILDENAERIPCGSDGLIIFPHFIGERVLGRYRCRGGFAGLSLKHTKSHIFRAILEGTTYELRRYLELIEGLTGRGFDSVRLVGGGAVSPLLRKIRANVYGRRVELLESFQGGLSGLAMLCMLNLKFEGGSLDRILKKFVRVVELVEPENELHQIYNSYYLAYEKLYDLIGSFYA